MRSMSIKSLLIAIFSILIVLLSALFGTLTYLSGAHNQISDAEHRRFQSFKLADELRQSSDDLTRMARTYVATGDERYAKYYQEILDIRDGVAPRPLHYDLVYWDLVGPDGQRPTEFGKPAALQLLMVAQNFTNVEFSKLREAQANSDDLVHLEVVAMNAVVGKFDDGSGEFLLVGEPDFELARGLMFSLDYHAAKAKIMAPINEFLIMLDMRTAREVARNTRAAKDLMVVALIISAVTVLFCISSFMVIRNRVLKPLVMIADSARVVSEGDYDRPVEYRSRDEVGTLVRAFNAMIASTKASFTTIREANEKLERHLKQIEDELAMAQQMQMSILPKQLPNRSDITMFGRMTAAREVGGDFYDVIEIDDDRIGIVIADVSGKGVPAALFMAVSCTVIKSIAARGGQPGHVLALANDILCDGNDADHVRDRLLRHHEQPHGRAHLLQRRPQPALSDAGGQQCGAATHHRRHGPRRPGRARLRRAQDQPRGWRHGVLLHRRHHRSLRYGGQRILGFAPLEEVLYHSRALSVETLGVKVIDHVHEFAGEAPQSDDITCLVMRYQPSEGPGERAAPVRPTVSTDQIVVRIANDLSELAPLAGIVEEFCERNEMPMKLAFNLKLALDEMITNTVSYGYEDGEKHTIEVRIMRRGRHLHRRARGRCPGLQPARGARGRPRGRDRRPAHWRPGRAPRAHDHGHGQLPPRRRPQPVDHVEEGSRRGGERRGVADRRQARRGLRSFRGWS